MTQTFIKVGNQKVDASEVTVPQDRTFRDAWVLTNGAIEINPTEKKKILRGKVNEERARRLEAGTVISVTGYGDIPVQGRDQDQITILALESTAKDLKAAGVTSAVLPFRDRDNSDHLLTPDQTLELMSKAKQYAQAIYQASWTLKDMQEIPEDYTDDKWWP